MSRSATTPEVHGVGGGGGHPARRPCSPLVRQCVPGDIRRVRSQPERIARAPALELLAISAQRLAQRGDIDLQSRRGAHRGVQPSGRFGQLIVRDRLATRRDQRGEQPPGTGPPRSIAEPSTSASVGRASCTPARIEPKTRVHVNMDVLHVSVGARHYSDRWRRPRGRGWTRDRTVSLIARACGSTQRVGRLCERRGGPAACTGVRLFARATSPRPRCQPGGLPAWGYRTAQEAGIPRAHPACCVVRQHGAARL
jgi:hypothetical protein